MTVLLRPGINIEAWPEVKFARAAEMREEFYGRAAAWESTVPLRTNLAQTGPQEARITLGVMSPPPLAALASSFGDAMHNLRASLDAAVWSMATFDGAEPTKPKMIQMPTYDNESDFDHWLKVIGGLPHPEFEERLRDLQPFRRVPTLSPGQSYTLTLLHELDIIDKHRNSIAAAAAVSHLEILNIEVDISPEDVKLVPEREAALEDGALLVTVTADRDFNVRSDQGVASAQFSVPHGGGFAPARSLFEITFGYVRNALRTLYGEFEPAPEMPAGMEAKQVSFDSGVVMDDDASDGQGASQPDR